MLDWVLLATQGMTVALKWMEVVVIAFLCGMSLAFRRHNPQVARLCMSVAQILAFSYTGAILSYAAMAASPFPLADAPLSRMDAAVGFHWLAWVTWVSAHPIFHFVLALSYASIPLQLTALLVYFGYVDARRVDELVLAGIMSTAIIIPVMVLLPAVGESSHHIADMVEPWRRDILALRSHTLMTVGDPDGIIFFPSFHTILGVLFINMTRGHRWFLPTLVLNLLLIASVMSEGSHYLVDMLSGLAVAWIAIAASQSTLAYCARVSIRMALPSRITNQSQR